MSNRANAGWELFASQPKEVDHFISMVGTGASTPTKLEGGTVSLNRTGVGVIEIIWADFPGKYMGCKGRCFEATVQSDLKGFTMVVGDFDTTNLKVTINITGAGEVLTDLAAAQRLSITFAFRQAQAVGV